jgi:hypothetical protein
VNGQGGRQRLGEQRGEKGAGNTTTKIRDAAGELSLDVKTHLGVTVITERLVFRMPAAVPPA